MLHSYLLLYRIFLLYGANRIVVSASHISDVRSDGRLMKGSMQDLISMCVAMSAPRFELRGRLVLFLQLFRLYLQ